MSKGFARRSKKGCGDPAAGPAVRIDELTFERFVGCNGACSQMVNTLRARKMGPVFSRLFRFDFDIQSELIRRIGLSSVTTLGSARLHDLHSEPVRHAIWGHSKYRRVSAEPKE
jgi:hypothetical protein